MSIIVRRPFGAAWSLASEPSLAGWYEARTSDLVYGIDPAVARWNARAGSLGYWSNAIAGDQPSWDGSGLLFNGIGDSLAHSAALASLRFLHDGTGVTAFVVCSYASGSYLLSNSNGAWTSGVGITVANNHFYASNASGTALLVDQALPAAFSVGLNLFEYGLSTAFGWDCTVTGVSSTAALVGACSAADASYALNLMRRQSGGWMGGVVREIIFLTKHFAPASTIRVNVRQYLAGKYGITLP